VEGKKTALQVKWYESGFQFIFLGSALRECSRHYSRIRCVSLTEIVSAFEHENAFDPIGGYGGLIPGWFKYGPLDKYFLGEFSLESYFGKMGRIYLLGCGDCGEVGCWPLVARVSVTPTTVLWDSFEQPHRRQRDYSKLGPFVFSVEQYRKAVGELCA
jgi:hypothetical protein